MSETDVQLDRRRNQEQWLSVVKHLLLCCGFSVVNHGDTPALCSPEGELVLQLPADFAVQH